MGTKSFVYGREDMLASRTLNCGIEMPLLGLGTWQSKANEVKNAVSIALKNGYRHIDTAWIYGNEEEIGEAFKETFSDSLSRKDVFLTSKLWNTRHHPDDVMPAIKDSLKKLQVDRLDLYLVHWPMDFFRGEEVFPTISPTEIKPADPSIPLVDTWKAMEDLVDAGLTKAIGISNFTIEQIQLILDHCRIRPAVLQVESHPYLQNTALVDFCEKNGIVVTAYSPLGSPARPSAAEGDPVPLKDPVLIDIGEKYGKSPAQVMIRWQIERKVVVIPKSVTPERIVQNGQVFDFQLTPDEMSRISALDKNWRAVAFGTT